MVMIDLLITTIKLTTMLGIASTILPKTKDSIRRASKLLQRTDINSMCNMYGQTICNKERQLFSSNMGCSLTLIIG